MQFIKELKYYLLAAIAALMLLTETDTTPNPVKARIIRPKIKKAGWTDELRGIVEAEYERNENADSVVAEFIGAVRAGSDFEVPPLEVAEESMVRKVDVNRRN